MEVYPQAEPRILHSYLSIANSPPGDAEASAAADSDRPRQSTSIAPHPEWGHLVPATMPGTEVLAKKTMDLLALDASLTQGKSTTAPAIPAQTEAYRTPMGSSSEGTPASSNSGVSTGLHRHHPQTPYGVAFPQPPTVLDPIPPTAAANGRRPSITKRSQPSDTSSTSSSSKRARTHSTGSARRSRSPGPTLLTPSQKKANHIQSEQKRRANIRRGYDALCATIPALRDAIRRDEEESYEGVDTKRRKGKAAVGNNGHPGDDLEKADGRSGPKSECVVLNKTIEHIQNLLSERQALLLRLERAQQRLGRAYPTNTCQEPPLWAREWTGGQGLMTNGTDGDELEDDGDNGNYAAVEDE